MDDDEQQHWRFQQMAQAIPREEQQQARPRDLQEQGNRAEASRERDAELQPLTSARAAAQQFTPRDVERWSRRGVKDQLNEFERVWRVRQVTGIEERQERIRNYKEKYPQEWQEFVETLDSHYRGMMEGKGEIAYKKKVVQWLSAHLKRLKPDAYLATGGSTVNHLGTSSSDLDLCICVHCGPGVDAYPETHVNHDTLQAFGHYLHQQNLVTKLDFVPARVPILKLVLRYPFEGVHVDINCNCVAGIFNSHMLCYYQKVDERFAPLAVVLKDWFKYARLSDSQNGYVNSYTVILMMVHYLQCAVSPPVLPNLISFHPNELDGSLRVHELDFDLDLPVPEIPRNTMDIGELLLGFYEYWANFDYATWGVSIREARLFDRATYVSPVRDNPLARPNREGLFYMEEAYDFLTVPKNLKNPLKLEEITGYLRQVRDRFLSESDGYAPYLSHLWILDRYESEQRSN